MEVEDSGGLTVPYSLPRMARQAGKRRDITLRPIIPTQAAATDLAAIYAPAWQIWADNIDRILAGYDPQPLSTADTLTIDTVDQVQAAISSVAQEFLTILTARIAPGLRQWVVKAERTHRSKWSAAIKAGVGVDLDLILSAQPVEETLGSWIGRNAALVRNVSDVTQSKIADAVFRGYQNRTPVRDVAKEIRESVGGSRARAIRIASHQNSSLSAALDTERQAEAGLDFFKWRHSAKRFPRQDHLARDGKIYNLRTGKERDGSGQVAADDRPGMKPFCGCRAQAWIPILSDIE
ncbi:phage minor head protein [Sphingobium sp. WTD-1]|uniref:phage minor head protein n=1 Tax=Sphingobium sp. WTD-1 TaxID=2979467 RepID=UPI0024DE2224|nr:phage minor head protein [Sphingobium sp. WTD-1]WIA54324.1 phage minor head protein [Sphingobium sp. WTD-1]